MRVEGSDFEVVAVDFVVNFMVEDNSNRMEDIDNIEQMSHNDFVLLVPKVEIDIEIEVEVEAKVAAKNSNLVGLKVNLIVKSLILWPQPRYSCNKTKIFYIIWDYFLLKNSLKTWD